MIDRRLAMTVCLSVLFASETLGARFQGLGDLPGGAYRSTAARVSDNGMIVVGGGESDRGTEAFQWQNGELKSLGEPYAGRTTYATAIAGDGSVIVGYAAQTDFGGTAVRFEESDIVQLGSLQGGISSFASGISTDGRSSKLHRSISGLHRYKTLSHRDSLFETTVRRYCSCAANCTLAQALTSHPPLKLPICSPTRPGIFGP